MIRPNKGKRSKSMVADWNKVQGWGWDGDRLARELIKFRQETMDELPLEFEPDPNDLRDILINLPDTWRIISTTPERIDGFWHFVPLAPHDFENAKQGEYHYGVVKPSMVLPLDEPGEHNILYLSLSLRPEHRQLTMSMYLLSSYLEALTQLANRGIFVKHVCANLGTPFAKKLNLALTLGLEYIGDHKIAGKMYLSYLPDVWKLPQFKLSPGGNIKQLCKLYGQHFTS
jgi:hypothetical protein